MHTPNADIRIYVPPNGAPKTPDAVVRGHLRGQWRIGEESNEPGIPKGSGARTFLWTDYLEVPLGSDLEDVWPAAPGTYCYEQNADGSLGTQYLIVFAERVRRQRGQEYLRVYLNRQRGRAVAIEVKEQDGTPDLTDVITLIFDQGDGFMVSQPAAGQAKVKLAAGGVMFGGARAYDTGTQPAADSTWTTITFNSERYDTDGYHSTVSNTSRLTIPSSGYYHVGACIEWSDPGGVAGSSVHVRFRVNGTTVICATTAIVGSGHVLFLNPSCDYLFSANDYVEVQVWQDSDIPMADQIISDANIAPEFWIHRLG
jgi:hypothetical protein